MCHPGRLILIDANYDIPQWIDRDTGIAGALFTQLMPPADAGVTGLLIELESALYGMLNGGPKGGVKL